MNDTPDEIGSVIAVEGNPATVQLLSSDSCGSCKARLFCRPDKQGNRTIVIENSI